MLASREIEQQVLGCILKDRTCLDRLDYQLDVASFSLPAHRLIFDAAQTIYITTDTDDMIQSVRLLLLKQGQLDKAGGSVYIIQCTESVGSTVRFSEYLKLLLDFYHKRRLSNVCSEVTKFFNENGTQLVDGIQLLESVLGKITGTDRQKVYSVADDMLPFIDETLSGERRKKQFVSTGIAELDRKIGGIYKGQVCIVAAPPSMGKTSWAVGTAVDNAQVGRKTLFFSLDEPWDAIFRRLVIFKTAIPSIDLRHGKLTQDQKDVVTSAATRLISIGNIYVTDKSNPTVEEIIALTRRRQRRNGLDLVVVDYVQKIAWGGDVRISRNYQLEHISAGLKTLAKELNVALIVLSQFNRDWSVIPDDQVPTMAMLRDSGALEQDANQMIFPWVPLWFFKHKYGERHPKYKKALAELGDSNPLALIIVKKHKEAATPTIECRIDPKRMMFYSEYKEEGNLPF